MKKTIILISTGLISLLLLGFLLINKESNSSILDKDEYIKWVEDEKNELVSQQIEGGIKYEVTYCPISYMISKEFRASTVSKESFDKRSKEMEGLRYFKLRFQRANSNEEVLAYNLQGGQEGYYKRVDYLSYGLEEDLKLVQNGNKDTLLPVLFHFERTYGVAPYIDFVVAFEKDTTVSDPHVVFVLDDKIFGGNVMRFDFNDLKLFNAPKLLMK